MSNILILFHDDNDGRCSAAIVKIKYPQAKTIALKIGDDVPWFEIDCATEVWLLDFSFNYGEMVQLHTMSKNVTWIDHHKTASSTYEKLMADGYCFGGIINCNNEIAACGLVWKYFSGDVEMNPVVKLINDYDCGKDDEDALCFHLGLIGHNTVDDFIGLVRLSQWYSSIQDTINDGNTISSHLENIAKTIHCQHINLNGYQVIAINYPHIDRVLFNHLWDRFNVDNPNLCAIMGYHKIKSGWYCGLKTKNEAIDVSLIAESFDGGGHKVASGFIVDDINKLLGE